MSLTDRVQDLVVPIIDDMGLYLYDIELNGGNLRITVDGTDGVLLDQLAQLTKAFSHVLDEEDPMPGKYTLEVSSPGVERRLRTPEHFAGAMDEEVNLKLAPHVDGDRRLRGVITAATDTDITLLVDDTAGADQRLTIDLHDITKAVTVFEWGPTPKPGSQPKQSKQHQNDDAAPLSSSNDPERRAAVQ